MYQMIAGIVINGAVLYFVSPAVGGPKFTFKHAVITGAVTGFVSGFVGAGIHVAATKVTAKAKKIDQKTAPDGAKAAG